MHHFSGLARAAFCVPYYVSVAELYAPDVRLLGASTDLLTANELPPAVLQDVTQLLPVVPDCHTVMRARKHAMKAA